MLIRWCNIMNKTLYQQLRYLINEQSPNVVSDAKHMHIVLYLSTLNCTKARAVCGYIIGCMDILLHSVIIK